MLDLDLAGGVLVDGQRVDHAHRVALAQTLELGDDLAVEIGLCEAQHDQLDRSNRHRPSSFGRGGLLRPASITQIAASSRLGDMRGYVGSGCSAGTT